MPDALRFAACTGPRYRDEVHEDLDPLAADEAASAGAILLDVREPEEFDAGHAPGARNLPLGQLAERVAELDAARPLVCVCRSGQRSAVAADALVAAGLDAANLAGGMLAWAAEGLAVVTASGAVGSVR